MAGEDSPPRFEKLSAMISMYIKAGSKYEINIETKMRNEVMKVCDPVRRKNIG